MTQVSQAFNLRKITNAMFADLGYSANQARTRLSFLKKKGIVIDSFEEAHDLLNAFRQRIAAIEKEKMEATADQDLVDPYGQSDPNYFYRSGLWLMAADYKNRHSIDGNISIKRGEQVITFNDIEYYRLIRKHQENGFISAKNDKDFEDILIQSYIQDLNENTKCTIKPEGIDDNFYKTNFKMTKKKAMHFINKYPNKFYSNYFTLEPLKRHMRKFISENSKEVNSYTEDIYDYSVDSLKDKSVTDLTINAKSDSAEFKVIAEENADVIIDVADDLLENHDCFKINVSIIIQIEHLEGEQTKYHMHIANFNENYLFKRGDNIMEVIMKYNEQAVNLLQSFETAKSGWTFARIDSIAIQFNRAQPIEGSTFFETPDFIKNLKCTLTPRNSDNKCFMYAILFALHHKEIKNRNCSRISEYKNYKGLYDWSDIEYPASVEHVKIFERKNKIGINVFHCNLTEKINNIKAFRSHIYPVYVSNKEYQKSINLLLLTKGDLSHYITITKLGPLIVESKFNQAFICPNCLSAFFSDKVLQQHFQDGCLKKPTSRTELPTEENSEVKFNNYRAMIRIPVVVYADCEAILKPINDTENPKIKQEHIPDKIAYYICSDMPSIQSSYHQFSGPDCIINFLSEMEKLSKRYRKLQQAFSKPENIIMNDQQKIDFSNSIECPYCHKEYAEDNKIVRHHNHSTGEYIGPACNKCNMQMRVSYDIPVLFHNGARYDNHFIMKYLSKVENKEKALKNIECIGKTTEKYISLNLLGIRLMDTFQHMGESLDRLTSYLHKDQHKILKKEYGNDIDKLLRKAHMFYSYITDESKYATKMKDITIADTFDILSNSYMSQKDFDEMQQAAKDHNCETVGEYYDFYLKLDVIHMADVFEVYRENCFNHYGLDPFHFPTAPGLTWQAWQLHMKKEGHSVHNIHSKTKRGKEAYMMLENAIRGGISMIPHRYSKINIKSRDDYNPNEPQRVMWYGDANNLYGWSMDQYLPCGEIEFTDEFDDLLLPDVIERIKSISPTADYGYFIEADLEIPSELHDKFKFYPPCPIHREGEYSEHMINIMNEKSISTIDSTKKLMCTLENKNKYTTHYRLLQLYLQIGVRLTKLHRVIKFKQAPIMSDYVRMNTKLRIEAKADHNDAMVALCKLMNNSLFGRTCMNVRNFVNIKMSMDPKKSQKYRSDPWFNRSLIIDEESNFAAYEINKKRTVLSQPIFIGCAILELSKYVMYNYYYNICQPYCQSKGIDMKLLFTDTDSLCIEFSSTNSSADIEDWYYNEYNVDLKNEMDMSVWKDHKNYDKSNEMIMGKMKCETGTKLIEEFIGLASKVYCFSTTNYTCKKAKGVNRRVANDLKLEQYKQANFQHQVINVDVCNFECKNHIIRTVKSSKIALAFYDNKRLVQEDMIETLPVGYVKQ